jgi:hypothetical protein
MSFFMVHLKIAEGFLARTDTVRNAGAFYLGCLAPDAIMFRPGCQRSDKALTHFCVGDEGWGYHTNYKDWAQSLNSHVEDLAGKTDADFLLGYFTHIFTDIHNSERIWTPHRLNPAPDHLNTFLKDCAEIDTRVMRGLRDRGLIWSVLKEPADYILPGIIKTGDMKILSEAFFRMYNKRRPRRRYVFSVITEHELNLFIEETVEKLLVHKNK